MPSGKCKHGLVPISCIYCLNPNVSPLSILRASERRGTITPWGPSGVQEVTCHDIKHLQEAIDNANGFYITDDIEGSEEIFNKIEG